MNGPKNDIIKEKADELRRRFEYSPEPQKSDRDLRDPPPNLPEKKASIFLSTVLELFKEAGLPPPLPAAAKLMSAVKKPNPMADALFSGMKSSPASNVMSSLVKKGHELTAGDRKELPKGDFAVSAKKSNTGKPAYPIPDEQHARSALGFAKMHGDSADYARVRAKVESKYPDLLKNAAFAPLPDVSMRNLLSHGGDAVKRLAKNDHAAELAGLGILGIPGLDALQAHGRAAAAGDYSGEGVKKRTVLPHVAHPLLETAGLGVLAAPSIAHLRGH